MVMDDEKLKRMLQEEMEREADLIMEEVNQDPNMKNVKVPDELHEKLFAQIRQYEEEKSYKSLSQEDKELIRLGKLYKKRRRLNIYLILAAAFVLALGACMTSLGGTKNVLRQVGWWLAGKEQTNTDTDSDRVEQQGSVSEEEAYEKIEKEFGIQPVKLDCLPEGTSFHEMIISTDMQNAQLIYKNKNGGMISYRIAPNYRIGSSGSVLDDKCIKEYNIEVNGTVVNIRQCRVEETGEIRWNVRFEHKDVHYTLSIVGVEEEKIEEIIKNLKIF